MAMQPCTVDDICGRRGLSVYVEFYGVLALQGSTIVEWTTQSYFRRVSGLLRGSEVKTCLKTKITFFLCVLKKFPSILDARDLGQKNMYHPPDACV